MEKSDYFGSLPRDASLRPSKPAPAYESSDSEGGMLFSSLPKPDVGLGEKARRNENTIKVKKEQKKADQLAFWDAMGYDSN
mmetsp:Transcript_41231/g.62736  ORF Transcript_41231/g.62736 Transcript_41231/m.62736 type:complete len:81 (-) Transcript_41231:1344-1586(-)